MSTKQSFGKTRLAASFASVSNGTLKNENQVPLRTLPAYVPRKKLRIITIGAGFSGLTLAHKLRYQHPEMEDLATHTIFEAHPDIGGTWLMNSYPGVQCDLPAHIYVCSLTAFCPCLSTNKLTIFNHVGLSL
jgi:NAD(P)-binding Rossmann-like domain